MTPLGWLGLAFVIGGIFFTTVAVIGIIRLPDLYTRAHAAGTADTLGTVLTLVGVAIVGTETVPRLKVILLVVFMFVTNPTAIHAIARAAFDQGIDPWTTGGEDG
jgi:multicomponent Na+:H+ antiporter subunit G